MSVINDTSEIYEIINRIYPIGSIIFTSQPLGQKTEWTDIPNDGELTVVWEGMTWKLLVDNPPPAMYTSFTTDVFTVRNCFVKYTRESNQDPWTARIFYDSHPEEYPPPTPHVKFTGLNTHRLIIDEIPSHSHNVASWYSSGNETFPRSQWITETNKKPSFGIVTDATGGSQPHNNKEEGYNCFFYERIQ